MSPSPTSAAADPRDAGVRASRWADREPDRARAAVARECGVLESRFEGFIGPDLDGRFLPRFDDDMMHSLRECIALLHELGFTRGTFSVEDWTDRGPLTEAFAIEGVTD